MSFYDKYYHRMPDGTVKQINPYNGTEVWCVEERRRGFFINNQPKELIPLEIKSPEDYCHFCGANTFYCTPEKARLFRDKKGNWKKRYRIPPEELDKSFVEFRRVGNLFEIVTYDYWAKNYHYKMNKVCRQWKEGYLHSKVGMEHALNVLELKLRKMEIDFDSLTMEEKIERMNPFFGGSHDIIIGGRHYKEGAKYVHELCSSGELSREEHFQYVKFTVESLKDIFEQNPFVRYISVFQNWLRPAGASFDHLHKQLVGLDEWGVQMEREIVEVIKNPNLYNEFSINFGIYNSLLIAENDTAVAVSEIGHRFPTITIYSKSEKSRIFEMEEEEIEGMSDLLHAVHTVITSQTTCNEEWYYAPFDSVYSIPWHICVKLRVTTPAGFEGNTKIYINPIHPQKLASEIISLMEKKRAQGLICKNIRIGKEIKKKPNMLQYYKGNIKRK